ncbi:MAG: hypothetical protein ACPG8W_19355 [Candidatus Promineifilaceae bacterium]
MNFVKDTTPPPADGWEGGYSTSRPEFDYPDPSFTGPPEEVPIYDNMHNIDKLQRQQKVIWPEFSWETRMGKKDPKRCFQMFASDISRIGYDNKGRVWSIMCPQQGVCVHGVCLNVEVTVTGQRGWVNEDDRDVSLAADMTVEGKIWFAPGSHDHWFVKAIWSIFDGLGSGQFPFTKEHAIRVSTHMLNKPEHPIFTVRKGLSDRFDAPEFTTHYGDKLWTVGHIDVQIGSVISTGDPEVDRFNQSIVDIFNMGSGNMLQKDNTLTWNVWFTPPEIVDQEEWAEHAETWRESMDVDHSHTSTPAKYADETLFKPRINYFKLAAELYEMFSAVRDDVAQENEDDD